MGDIGRETFDGLRPTKAMKVIDLVADSGVDTAPWAFRQDGSPVKHPAANPNYCYEWAFGGNDESTVLCIWHKSMVILGDAIVYDDCIREFAVKLDRVAIDRTNPSHVKSRARDQAKRARKFDSLLQRAFRTSAAVRVIVLLGDAETRETGAAGWDTEKVKFRRLDDSSWHVQDYRDDGSFRLIRGEDSAVDPSELDGDAESDTSTPSSADPQPEQPRFLDQFSLPELPEKHESQGSAYIRSALVREHVLARAGGICEHCGTMGFETRSGAIYLETHHVVPLSEKGPDVEWNVVAICPNDHRRAHYATDREQMRRDLIANLIARYPDARAALENLQSRCCAEDGSS